VDSLSVGHLLSSPAARSRQAGAGRVEPGKEREWEALFASGRIPKDLENNTGFLRFLCRQLEAVSINTLFQAARKTVPQEGPLSGGFAGSMYQGLADEEYSRMIANRGGFGVGDALFGQIMGRRAYAAAAEQAHSATSPQASAAEPLGHEDSTGTSRSAPQGAPRKSDN